VLSDRTRKPRQSYRLSQAANPPPVKFADGQLYDYEQLSKAVGNRTELPAAELCRSLIDEIQHSSATQEFNYDVCLVAMDIDRLKPL
jgi:hypothetical protein